MKKVEEQTEKIRGGSLKGGVLEIVTTCLWPNLGFPQDIVEYNNNLPLFSAQSGVLES